jgi:hypothetical protein
VPQVETALSALLEASLGSRRASDLLASLEIDAALLTPRQERVSRAVLAMAMNVVLFEDVQKRVPAAEAYVQDQVRAGRKIVFDHGALRSVAAPSGQLPAGQLAFARFLEPLGYTVNGTYPLDRLAMTGRAYAHRDLPESIPQFFVSELHPGQFSAAFQGAAARVLSTSRDPLPAWAPPLLDELTASQSLPWADAQRLLPNLAACFDRQHTAPSLIDYEALLAESAEMAWIATEGNAFNHATDRVSDVVALTQEQKRLGRPMKDEVEVSGSGRIIQTAYRAAEVERIFVDAEGRLVLRRVPGSFFEFITRKHEENGTLDLRFDASNAQAIFKMTAAGAH